MRKPIIGLVPQVDTDNERFWIRQNYFSSVLSAGGIPMLMPLTDDPRDISHLVSMFDGVILSGGVDIEPRLYGEATMPYCKKTVPERDAFETLLISELRARKMPTLGICRGLQAMNVALGGSLYQDIDTQYPTVTVHTVGGRYEQLLHSVYVLSGTPLEEAVGADRIRVNSAHHQAIKRLAPPLTAMAVSEDGLIEAVYDRNLPFFVGVQWHPEGSYATDENSRLVIGALIDAAKAVMAEGDRS